MKILIMAGGTGERFWPLSTKEKPKQLLSLVSDKSMIRETVDRVLNYVNPNDIYVATNEIQSKGIMTELTDIPKRNIIIEPAFKDTAAAIAYGSTIISRDSDHDEVIAVLASDHLIENVDEFIKSIAISEKISYKGYIVTLGIKPRRPETGYGYIQIKSMEINTPTDALKFMEKPNQETANKYIEQGDYVWNSGMFIFKYSIIMKEMKKYIPNHIKVIENIKKNLGDLTGMKLSKYAKKYFADFERISIDFAIMEKSKIIKCIPVDFGWNDIGGYNSLEEVFGKNTNRNVVKNATYIQLDSYNNIIITNKKSRLITSIGISNTVIVDTNDALLVCKRSDTQRIKELLKEINDL